LWVLNAFAYIEPFNKFMAYVGTIAMQITRLWKVKSFETIVGVFVGIFLDIC